MKMLGKLYRITRIIIKYSRYILSNKIRYIGQLYKVQTLEQITHAFNNIIGGIKNDPYPLSKLNHMRPLKKTCGVHLNLVEQG
jgi:hypothetical protein